MGAISIPEMAANYQARQEISGFAPSPVDGLQGGMSYMNPAFSMDGLTEPMEEEPFEVVPQMAEAGVGTEPEPQMAEMETQTEPMKGGEEAEEYEEEEPMTPMPEGSRYRPYKPEKRTRIPRIFFNPIPKTIEGIENEMESIPRDETGRIKHGYVGRNNALVKAKAKLLKKK
jgi:hypothetical protein